MPAVSSTRIGLIDEPQGSKVKKLEPSVNTPAQTPFAPNIIFKNIRTESVLALSAARLPAIPFSSSKTKIRKIIDNEINCALDLGISTCSRLQYGFMKAIRSLEKGRPNLYSAFYAGFGFSSFFGMALLPKVAVGILMKDPAFASNLLSQTLQAESLNAAVCFAVPFCLNLIGKFKFLESNKVTVNIKGFDLAPADLTKAISIIGVALSSFSMLFVIVAKNSLKAAKNKNAILKKEPALDGSEKAYSINWSSPNIKIEDWNYYGNGTTLNQSMHPFGIVSPAPVSVKNDDK